MLAAGYHEARGSRAHFRAALKEQNRARKNLINKQEKLD